MQFTHDRTFKRLTRLPGEAFHLISSNHIAREYHNIPGHPNPTKSGTEAPLGGTDRQTATFRTDIGIRGTRNNFDEFPFYLLQEITSRTCRQIVTWTTTTTTASRCNLSLYQTRISPPNITGRKDFTEPPPPPTRYQSQNAAPRYRNLSYDGKDRLTLLPPRPRQPRPLYSSYNSDMKAPPPFLSSSTTPRGYSSPNSPTLSSHPLRPRTNRPHRHRPNLKLSSST